MGLDNHTPFPSLLRQSRDADGAYWHALVLRATLRFAQDRELGLAEEQEPMRLRYAYRGDPTTSSLVADNDLAPFKPRTDIHVSAVARAPGGMPAIHRYRPLQSSHSGPVLAADRRERCRCHERDHQILHAGDGRSARFRKQPSSMRGGGWVGHESTRAVVEA